MRQNFAVVDRRVKVVVKVLMKVVVKVVVEVMWWTIGQTSVRAAFRKEAFQMPGRAFLRRLTLAP